MRGATYGPYELLRKIAAGGMAEVFLARRWGEAGFFRDVVVKRVFPHLAENERVLRMFQDEARLLAELRHPNIPQVTDLGRADGTWYIAMELVDGHNVADLWRAGARARHVMPLPVALGIVMQTCEALHHAHTRRDRAGAHLRIVHRDVTPHNVMITRDGVVKLMDFGVAQTAARKDTDVGVVKGTFSYMAPEQVRGWPLDRRADVFAVGVILYELTTGTRLFRGNDVQVMTTIVEEDAPLPSSRVPGYPPELEAVVMRALARDREHRYAASAALARDLEAFAIGHGMLVGPRAVADYFNAVFPAQQLREEGLGLVEPPSASAAPPQVAGADALTDADGVLADLELLSKPLSDAPGPVATPSDGIDPIRADIRKAASTAPPPAPGGTPPAGHAAAHSTRTPTPDDEEEGEYVRDLGRRLEVDREDG